MTSYRIEIVDGGAIVTDADGVLIGYREFESLLRAMAKSRRDYQAKYVALVKSAADFNELFPDSRLIYPFIHQWAIHIPYSGRRPANAPIFSGAYVISTKEHPNIVKIGRTKDMYLRSFEWDSSKSPFSGRVTYDPIAFIHTPLQVDVERYMHLLFADVRERGNEWFAREPVEAWLRQIQARP